MPVRTAAWPIEALPFEEILTPVVESFLEFQDGRAFDFSRSAIRQLYDRVDELESLSCKDELLALIRDQLGEFDCLAICNSGYKTRNDDEYQTLSYNHDPSGALIRIHSFLEECNYD